MSEKQTMPTLNETRASIRGIGESMKSLRERVQAVLVPVVFYALNGEGDALAQSLFAKMQGADRTALAKWLVTFGPFHMKGGEIRISKERKAVMKWDDQAQLIADAQPWYELGPKPEQIEKTLDVSASVDLLIKRATDAAKNGKSVHNARLLEYLRDAKAKFHADLALEEAQSDKTKTKTKTKAEQKAELQAEA